MEVLRSEPDKVLHHVVHLSLGHGPVPVGDIVGGSQESVIKGIGSTLDPDYMVHGYKVIWHIRQ